MSANAQIRAMLDELMGTGRNGDQEKSPIKFDDPEVCKCFLLDICPHDILMSTRHEIGECPLIHNLAFRADYELASKEKDYYFDLDALHHLTLFVAEADRKMEHAKDRLQDIKEEISEEIATKADRVRSLTKELDEAVVRAEKLGADGLVEESVKLMDDIELLRGRRSVAEKEFKASISETNCQQQKLRICDVCGVHLGIYDNDFRLADHFGGKLHMGFIKIRETLKNFQEAAEERRAKKRGENGEEGEEAGNLNGRGREGGMNGRNGQVKRPDRPLYTVNGGRFDTSGNSWREGGRGGGGRVQYEGFRHFKPRERHGRRRLGRSRSPPNFERKRRSRSRDSSSSDSKSSRSSRSTSRSSRSSSGSSRSSSGSSRSSSGSSRSRSSSRGKCWKRKGRELSRDRSEREKSGSSCSRESERRKKAEPRKSRKRVGGGKKQGCTSV